MDMVEIDGRKIPATYLGDAVYCLFDGYSYWLRLNDHRNKEGEICLEPSVLENLIKFKEDCNQLRENEKRKESENLANSNSTEEG